MKASQKKLKTTIILLATSIRSHVEVQVPVSKSTDWCQFSLKKISCHVRSHGSKKGVRHGVYFRGFVTSCRIAKKLCAALKDGNVASTKRPNYRTTHRASEPSALTDSAVRSARSSCLQLPPASHTRPLIWRYGDQLWCPQRDAMGDVGRGVVNSA